MKVRWVCAFQVIAAFENSASNDLLAKAEALRSLRFTGCTATIKISLFDDILSLQKLAASLIEPNRSHSSADNCYLLF